MLLLLLRLVRALWLTRCATGEIAAAFAGPLLLVDPDGKATAMCWRFILTRWLRRRSTGGSRCGRIVIRGSRNIRRRGLLSAWMAHPWRACAAALTLPSGKLIRELRRFPSSGWRGGACPDTPALGRDLGRRFSARRIGGVKGVSRGCGGPRAARPGR
jgi:hypothetical protein